jgi:polyhydroxybutyrate depolymerase
VHIISAVERQSTTTTNSLQVGSVTRQYEVIAPTATLSKSAPIVVVLGGADSTTSNEIARDDFLPAVNDDKAELVYPVEIDKSWNAIGCCDGAAKANVNDVGFIEALVPKIDPGHTRPVYVVGYSNGGRLAYRLACTDPTLFDGMVALKADPMPGCVVTKPENILVFSSLNDKFVPYEPGEKGEESPPATVQIARLQTDLKCSGKPTVAKHGTMSLSTWSCANGKTLEWALYQTGGHNIPDPDGSTPGALPLILSFIAATTPAPVSG